MDVCIWHYRSPINHSLKSMFGFTLFFTLEVKIIPEKPFADFPQALVGPSHYGELCQRDFAHHRAAQSHPWALIRPCILVIHSLPQFFPFFSLLSPEHSFIAPLTGLRWKWELQESSRWWVSDGFSPCRPSTFCPCPHVLQGLVIHRDHGHPHLPLFLPKCLLLGDLPIPTVSRFMFSFASLLFGILIVIKLLLSSGKFSLHQGQGKHLKTVPELVVFHSKFPGWQSN